MILSLIKAKETIEYNELPVSFNLNDYIEAISKFSAKDTSINKVPEEDAKEILAFLNSSFNILNSENRSKTVTIADNFLNQFADNNSIKSTNNQIKNNNKLFSLPEVKAFFASKAQTISIEEIQKPINALAKVIVEDLKESPETYDFINNSLYEFFNVLCSISEVLKKTSEPINISFDKLSGVIDFMLFPEDYIPSDIDIPSPVTGQRYRKRLESKTADELINSVSKNPHNVNDCLKSILATIEVVQSLKEEPDNQLEKLSNTLIQELDKYRKTRLKTMIEEDFHKSSLLIDKYSKAEDISSQEMDTILDTHIRLALLARDYNLQPQFNPETAQKVDDFYVKHLNNENFEPKISSYFSNNDLLEDKDLKQLKQMVNKSNGIEDINSSEYKKLRDKILQKEFKIYYQEIINPEKYLNRAVKMGVTDLASKEKSKAIDDLRLRACFCLGKMNFLSSGLASKINTIPFQKIADDLFNILENEDVSKNVKKHIYTLLTDFHNNFSPKRQQKLIAILYKELKNNGFNQDSLYQCLKKTKDAEKEHQKLFNYLKNELQNLI